MHQLNSITAALSPVRFHPPNQRQEMGELEPSVALDPVFPNAYESHLPTVGNGSVWAQAKMSEGNWYQPTLRAHIAFCQLPLDSRP